MDLGFRLDIAKHVVFNVMSTLSEDDFITVLTFANDTRSLVDWFVDPLGDPELVQASKENIGEFTESVKQIQTQGIANFSIAFNAASNLMEKYRANKVNDIKTLCEHFLKKNSSCFSSRRSQTRRSC